MPNYGGFSWRRLTGISAAKSRISRATGIPWTRSGRQRKIGGLCCGCLVIIIVLVVAGVAMAVMR
ncbi:MAG: hypothetical protein WCP21_14625 [Armatimonadota bacterium]